jgi:MoaF C-terminal domain/MoaF N-terminal domain
MDTRQPDYRAFLIAEDYLLQEEVQAFRLPRTADLVGQSLTLYPDDHNAPGGVDFKDHTTLIWRGAHQTPHTGLYDAIQLRPDIYFVDWVVPDAPNETKSVVLDFLRQEATIVHCRLPKSTEEASFDFAHRISQYNDLSTAKVNVGYAGIGQPRQTYHHRQTEEVIGRRLIHFVSDQHQYEHIYLNQHTMAWQSYIGPDQGLGEVSPCNYVKIDEDLFVVIIRAVFTLEVLVLVEDFASQRSNGKIFFASVRDYKQRWNHTVGTRLKLLKELRYD